VFAPQQGTTSQEDLQEGELLVDRLHNSLSSDFFGDYLARVDIVGYRMLPLVLSGKPIPPFFAQDKNKPGGDNLDALLEEVKRLTRTNDMPRRIELCKQGIEVVQSGNDEHDKEKCAWLQSQLGDSLINNHALRNPEDRAENLEQAIRAYEAALTVFTEDKYPQQWAAIQQNLGNAFYERSEEDPRQNIENAITAYQNTLKIMDKHSKEWAAVQNSLGNAYAESLSGDPVENLEKAIQAYKDALTVLTQQAFPEDWAQTMDNLGHAYADRRLGDPAENIEKAIEAYRDALKVRTPETLPEGWAATQNNLGNAYDQRKSGLRDKNVEEAKESFEAALTVYTEETFPQYWAMAKVGLGIAYSSRISGDPAQNLEDAIGDYQEALKVYSPKAFPRQWAAAQNGLGDAYRRRREGDPGENLQQALIAYQRALQIYRPETFPKESRTSAGNLAQVHIELQHWPKAYEALHTTLDAAEYLYATSVTEESKSAQIAENARIYQKMVKVCISHNPPLLKEAFIHIEESRSRLLRDQLGALPLQPPRNVPAALIKQETRLLQIMREMEHAIRGLGNDLKGSSDKNEAVRVHVVGRAAASRAQLEALWDTLADQHEATEYVALRRGEKLKWNDIHDWLAEENVALLEFFTLESGVLIYAIRKDGMKVVPPSRFPLSQLAKVVDRFTVDVREYDPVHPIAETWQTAASDLLSDLFTIIIPFLNGAELVYVIPHGLLHNLPLHALMYQGKPLIEYFPIAYAPSAAIAMRKSKSPHLTLSHRKTRRNKAALVIGNPTGDQVFAEEEAKQIGERFHVKPLLSNATKARVQAQLSGKALAHFATHAHFDPEDPFASGMRLADGILTAREVLEQRLDTELMVLSGCETGLSHVGPGDELAGVARAFLYAGVSSLILSSWRVSNKSTVLFMDSFYNYLYDNDGGKKNTTAEAVRQATLEVRREFSHTYHWAPFALFGNCR
jgi:CHAT domain-containing protein/tetratricopeptide (TPR) repeat protein